MEFIKPGILKTLQGLSRTNIDFLEFMKNNPEGLKQSSYAELMKFDVDPSKTQPWPTFISQQVKKQLQEAGTAVFHLIKKVPQRLFANDPQKIAAYFGYPQEYTLLQMESIKGGHIENLLARGDFIFSANGIKCIEYNVSVRLGGWQLPILESIYLNTSIIAKFLKQYQVKIRNNDQYVILLQHLLNTARKKFPGPRHREINIAIAMPEYKKTGDNNIVEEHLNRSYQQVLKEHDSDCSGTIIFCDFPMLTVKDDCIFFEGKQVNSLLEWYNGDVPQQILYVSLMGNVILYNGYISTLLSNKLILALLSENEENGVFTPIEREIIKTFIPWTRRVVHGDVRYGTGIFDMEDLLCSHRQKLVIKPVTEMGGEGVHVGKFTLDNQWEEIIYDILEDKTGNWIVQEYLEPEIHLYQYGDEGYAEHQTTWGLFVFGSEYAGGFLRLMPKNHNNKGIINTHQGARRTVVLEVEE